MQKRPYILVLGSHKGGTGRTTSALALAFLWGQAGWNVALVDADRPGAASMVAVGPDGTCSWEGVSFYPHLPESIDSLCASPTLQADVAIIDAPPLTDPGTQRVLRLADGVVLTCLADPLSLRTIPRAARALEQANRCKPRLDLLGLQVGVFNANDCLQGRMMQQLRRTYGDLVLEPPVPSQQEISDWASDAGSPLPDGPAQESYVALAGLLGLAIGLGKKCKPPPRPCKTATA